MDRAPGRAAAPRRHPAFLPPRRRAAGGARLGLPLLHRAGSVPQPRLLRGAQHRRQLRRRSHGLLHLDVDGRPGFRQLYPHRLYPQPRDVRGGVRGCRSPAGLRPARRRLVFLDGPGPADRGARRLLEQHGPCRFRLIFRHHDGGGEGLRAG